MTAISHNSKSQFANFISKGVIEYQITGVTFEGEEVHLIVEAANPEEATEIAMSENPNIDYLFF